MAPQRKFILDTDAGIDDAQAILMALKQQDVEVIAITTCHGNVGVDQVAINIIRILETAKKLQIPVFKGCQTSLMGTKGDSSFYHGKDGLGECFEDLPPDVSAIQSKHAVCHLVETVKKYPGEITLVCLAPLTNIAMAIRLDPDFSKNLKECYIMGGNYEGKGNVTYCAEYNFHTDPEAADVVLREMQCPLTLTCWELCLKYSLHWELYRELRQPTTEVCKFLKKIEEFITKNCPFSTYIACDEIAMATALNPNIISRSERHQATVELSGTHTRGQVILKRDLFNKTLDGTTHAPKFVFELDKMKYEEMLRSLAKHEFV